MDIPTLAGPIYLHIKVFHAGSPAAADVEADSRSKLDAAAARGFPMPSGGGSPVKTMREWRELLGDPPTISHPQTGAKAVVPLERFANEDPDKLLLTIGWEQYSAASAARLNLPPAGQPIIDVLDG
jgi:hypothetical protein